MELPADRHSPLAMKSKSTFPHPLHLHQRFLCKKLKYGLTRATLCPSWPSCLIPSVFLLVTDRHVTAGLLRNPKAFSNSA